MRYNGERIKAKTWIQPEAEDIYVPFKQLLARICPPPPHPKKIERISKNEMNENVKNFIYVYFVQCMRIVESWRFAGSEAQTWQMAWYWHVFEKLHLYFYVFPREPRVAERNNHFALLVTCCFKYRFLLRSKKPSWIILSLIQDIDWTYDIVSAMDFLSFHFAKEPIWSSVGLYNNR